MSSPHPPETKGAPIVPADMPAAPPLVSERERRLEQALRHIVQWAASYPARPAAYIDMAAFRKALEAASLNLDDVTNAAMWHVLKDAAIIAEDALGPHA